MAARNYSMWDYLNKVAAERKPRLTFEGKSKADWERWRGEFSAKLMELCGEWPQQVDPKPEVIYSVDEGDFLREKVVIDTERHFSVPMYVLIPKDRKRAKGGKLPAIVALHGHGQFGKEPVAGATSIESPGIEASMKQHNYDYGRQMAREGYVTIVPDSRAFGELSPTPDRDTCGVHFIRGSLLGINLLTLNIWDMMKVVDYLVTRPEVDPERVGAMGLSWGGTRTTFLSAMDGRIKAADIICYVTQFEEFAIHMGNFCGSQFLPNLFKYGDVADVAGLIAPRPLLVENGTYDLGFPIEASLRAHEHLRRIYRAAGVEDRFDVDVFLGGHQFHGPSARKFFEQYL
jgi:dienelactone hydrolase